MESLSLQLVGFGFTLITKLIFIFFEHSVAVVMVDFFVDFIWFWVFGGFLLSF